MPLRLSTFAAFRASLTRLIRPVARKLRERASDIWNKPRVDGFRPLIQNEPPRNCHKAPSQTSQHQLPWLRSNPEGHGLLPLLILIGTSIALVDAAYGSSYHFLQPAKREWEQLEEVGRRREESITNADSDAESPQEIANEGCAVGSEGASEVGRAAKWIWIWNRAYMMEKEAARKEIYKRRKGSQS